MVRRTGDVEVDFTFCAHQITTRWHQLHELLSHIIISNYCSSLNNDLYLKNITDSPLCRCGSIENTYHLFFQYSYYTPQRALLFDTLSGYMYCEITLRLLLFGDISLSHDTNKNIFQQVQKYNSDTKRF